MGWSIMIDLIGSSIVVGILILSIMGINVNMNNETAKSLSEFHIQTEVIQLARILENDIFKIGYDIPKVPGTHKIVTADTARLKFMTNLWNIAGKKDSVEYILGGSVTTSV